MGLKLSFVLSLAQVMIAWLLKRKQRSVLIPSTECLLLMAKKEIHAQKEFCTSGAVIEWRMKIDLFISQHCNRG